MATWGDAIKRRDAAFIAASHFERTEEEAKQRISDAFDEVGVGIMQDRRIGPKGVERLPQDTTLGPEAEKAYKKLVQLVS